MVGKQSPVKPIITTNHVEIIQLSQQKKGLCSCVGRFVPSLRPVALSLLMLMSAASEGGRTADRGLPGVGPRGPGWVRCPGPAIENK